MAGQPPSEPWQPADAAPKQNDPASTAKQAASSAVATVKTEAANFADTAKDKAQQTVEEKKGVASDALADFANAVRRAGEELSQSDRSTASRMVQQAAEGLEGLSRAVSEKRPEELLHATRDFARSNPTAMIAGSVLAGLALGRFLRASDKSDAGQSNSSSEPRRLSGMSQPVSAPSTPQLGGGAGGSQAPQASHPEPTAQGYPSSDMDPASRTMDANGLSDAEEVTSALGRDPRLGDTGASEGEG